MTVLDKAFKPSSIMPRTSPLDSKGQGAMQFPWCLRSDWAFWPLEWLCDLWTIISQHSASAKSIDKTIMLVCEDGSLLADIDVLCKCSSTHIHTLKLHRFRFMLHFLNYENEQVSVLLTSHCHNLVEFLHVAGGPTPSTGRHSIQSRSPIMIFNA